MKANSKEIRYDIDLTKSLDSADLSQRTHQVIVLSHSETDLGLLEYETAGDAGTSRLKKSRITKSTIPLMNGIILGSMPRYSKYFTKVRSRTSTIRGENCSLIPSKGKQKLKIALKKIRESKSKYQLDNVEDR